MYHGTMAIVPEGALAQGSCEAHSQHTSQALSAGLVSRLAQITATDGSLHRSHEMATTAALSAQKSQDNPQCTALSNKLSQQHASLKLAADAAATAGTALS